VTIVIGVDLGIRKIAAAVWHDRDQQELVWTGAYTAEAVSRGYDLKLCGEWISSVAGEQLLLTRDTDEELYIFIEMPLIGNNRKYSMAIAENYGAVLSALAIYRNVFGVNVSEWKKQVIGKGNAGKEDVVNHISVVNSSYSAICGYDQDRYDAAAVGLYGVLVAARADIIAPRSS